ncbi:MAG: glycosyltransferase family 39 protein [Candidatus Omnitrophota bacterium]
MRTLQHIAILSAISGFLFLFSLGRMPLTDPDETFYAQTAREMVEHNEWITPTIFGDPQFEKPVLYYWLIEISYKVFGISEFAARFPSALFGILGVIGIYFLSRLLFSPLCGLFSGLITATSGLYLVLARACVTDMVLMVFVLYCLLFFLYAWKDRKFSYYILSSCMAAFAVLTKGPIGLLIPGVVIFSYIVTDRRWTEIKTLPVISAAAVFSLICLPWYIIAAKLHGETFLSEFFGYHNVTRFLSPEHKIGSSPFFYIPILLGGLLPWTPFFLLGSRELIGKNKTGEGLPGYRLFLTVWFLFVFLFFSVSRTKLITYVFPLFPVLAVMAGRFWERYVTGREENSRKIVSVSYFLLIAAAFAGTAAAVIIIHHKYNTLAFPVALVCLFFTAGVVLSYFFVSRNKKYLSFVTIVSVFIVLSVPTGMWIAPVLAESESSKTLAAILNDMAGEKDPVGGESDNRRGVAFYSGRKKIVDIHQYNNLNDFVSRQEKVWGIMKYKHYEQLMKKRPDIPLSIIARSGKYILVTNKTV